MSSEQIFSRHATTFLNRISSYDETIDERFWPVSNNLC